MLSASSAITRCCSALPGSPIGRPNGNRTAATRGGRIRSATCAYIMTCTVGMPSASMALAISPPDRLHTGQVDVSTTACTPSAFNRRATSGAVSVISRSGRWMKPMNE